MEKQRTYGFISNFIYALNIARKSNLKLLAVVLIKPVANIVTNYCGHMHLNLCCLISKTILLLIR